MAASKNVGLEQSNLTLLRCSSLIMITYGRHKGVVLQTCIKLDTWDLRSLINDLIPCEYKFIFRYQGVVSGIPSHNATYNDVTRGFLDNYV